MCGIVGIVSKESVNQQLYDALTVLQHRGQDAAGMATSMDGRLHLRKGNGLVRDVFLDQHMQSLVGNIGIGHCRYPTAGSSSSAEAQPMYVNSPYGITLAHNGNLTNGIELRRNLVKKGAIFQSTTDTEALLHLIAQSKKSTMIKKIIDALFELEGAYSIGLLTNKKLIAIKDPLGIRPLVMGELKGAKIIASETCALDIIGAKYIRDIDNGEIVISKNQNLDALTNIVIQNLGLEINEKSDKEAKE